jgi:hypothetical protein
MAGLDPATQRARVRKKDERNTTMASLILGVIGNGLGASLFGPGTFLGISGAQLGGALGAFLGTEIDAAIAPGRSGPRLSDTNIQASTEGAPIPRLYGRTRAAGQLIWASRFKETQSTTGSGKGFAAPGTSETDFAYSISFAVGLSEAATRIGRIWANGTLVDASRFTLRFYPGSETQAPDPLIATIEGEDNAPAFRGLAYVVFEDMPLADFGNRIPQLQFEVFHALAGDDALETALTGVALIPGAGEFVYADAVVSDDDGEGATTPQNAHNAAGVSDLDASLDELTALAPNLQSVSLVVGWFGSDLRAGHCTLRPGVEIVSKDTYPQSWSVAGIARDSAYVVSAIDGRPAYGGTPSDASVTAAIRNLAARGLRVLFCPFVLMDIAPGNTLSDPYTGAAGQPAYPWRGRTTCDPAPGIAGSPDTTATAATQLNTFFTATNGYRAMILHYAQLCADAGGVDAFLIGSELRGLTRVRDGAASYPAVAALKTLAADVRALLGPDAKIGYAADWSEYASHDLGGGALLFNLDPLWSDGNIDFIGIDNYMPLADWRDGAAHADYDPAGPTAIHDPAYLAGNIRGGEDYDWYYASDADRAAQARTPITDGLGKPWVFRAKDLWGWWSNPHHDRPGSSESATPTAWTPQSKPIWFTELGCPAADKGANQPNVFFDPKSSESALPYFSNGERDDLIQRRFLEAHFAFWSDPANNPTSPHYAGRMVDVANIRVWCWDARPYPFFPARADVWGDAANWRLGHWLNGRLGTVQLPALVEAIAGDDAVDTTRLSGLVTGYAVTATMSARDALEPLGVAYHFDAAESEGVIRFVMRGQPVAPAIAQTDLVLDDNEPGFGFTLTRAQETDLPNASRIQYIDADADYRQASAEARRLATLSGRIATSSLPLVMDQGQAIGLGERLLQDAWVMRETAVFALPPSRLALDVTDEIALATGDRDHRLRLTQIDDAGARRIEAVATDPSLYEPLTGPGRAPNQMQSVTQPGRALVVFLDLPLLSSDATPWAPWAAATADPWPGSVAILRSATDSNFTPGTRLTSRATLGRTTADFYPGPLWRWDTVNALRLRLGAGTLSSRDDLTVLGGANALAIENADGAWEIVQFATATLTAPGEWTLTRLLRGQQGSEGAMRAPAAAGARVVLLDSTLRQLDLEQNEATLPFHYAWGPPGKALADPSWQTAERQFAAIGLRPLSPVHLAATWQGSDLLLAWTRRTRVGGDAWDQSDVPLAEESERYEIDILGASGLVVRTLTTTAPTATYTAAQIAADFPSGLPSPFHFAVAQLSAAFGPGTAAAAAVVFG